MEASDSPHDTPITGASDTPCDAPMLLPLVINIVIVHWYSYFTPIWLFDLHKLLLVFVI